MRNFLTFVAVALVTALVVALVGPPFIDWTARRAMVARVVAARIGAPVAISGAVKLRLLPTPFLEIADVAIGPARSPWLRGRAIRFQFGFASLFGSKLALDDVTFEAPELTLGPRLAPPGEARVAFGHIRAVHAEIRVERADAAPILLHDVTFDGSAASARGPWRGDGDLAYGGGRASYQFVSEAFADEVLPLKAEFEAGATRVDFDGRLALAPTPSLAGSATVAGEVAALDGAVWPWRVAGDLSASGAQAALEKAELRLGADARALEGVGRLTLRGGERPSLDADLTAKTLNIDALLRQDKQAFATPARGAEALEALAARALGPGAPLAAVSLTLQARAAYLGARTLDAPKLALSGAPDGPMRLTFDAGLPGHGRVAVDGSLELRPAPIFRGRGEGAVGDFATLAGWIAEGQPALAARLADLGATIPQGAVSASGDVELSPEGYSVRGLGLAVASSRFDGSVVYRRPAADRRGRLYLDLASAALDIEAAPNVEAGLDWLGETDLDFRLKADALKVARVGLASVSGGSLVVRAKKDGQKFALETLSLADFDGASIQAEGESSPSGRWTRVKLDARRLGDFAALLARAAPSALTNWFLRRAGDLGAAKATFEARRDGPPLDGPFGLDFLKADGEIADSRFGLTVSRAPAPVDAVTAQATLDSADAGALLRKLGVKLPPGQAGRGELAVSGTGRWDRGFEGKARLSLAGADLAGSGVLRPQDEANWLQGSLTLKSADLFPALAALGMGAAGTGATAPADLTAGLADGVDGARVSQLTGSLAGSLVAGNLAWEPPPPTDPLAPDAAPLPAITGALELDRASLSGLLSLILGRPAPAAPGAVWSPAKFGPALLSPPGFDVALKVGALDLGFGVGRALTSRLRMDRDRLQLDDASLSLAGGQIGGRLDLRRGKAQATAEGDLALTGVEIERAPLSARLDAKLDFIGAGESAATLIAGLAGGGRVAVEQARVARLDPQALARAFARIEQTNPPPLDEKKIESLIGAELDKGPLALAKVEGALTLASGALGFGPFPTPEGLASVSGAFDLDSLSLAMTASQTQAKVGRFWSGPPPQVEVSLKAPPEPAPRKVDAALLAAGLASEAIARESDRIENFEADVRERAMFNRQRKAAQFLARRQTEIAAYFADQERRRLMDHYLGPYSDFAASHREPPHAKDAAGL